MTDELNELNELKPVEQLKEDFVQEIMELNNWSREDAEALCNLVVNIHEQMDEASKMMWRKHD